MIGSNQKKVKEMIKQSTHKKMIGLNLILFPLQLLCFPLPSKNPIYSFFFFTFLLEPDSFSASLNRYLGDPSAVLLLLNREISLDDYQKPVCRWLVSHIQISRRYMI